MDIHRRGDDPYLFQFYASLPIADETEQTLKHWVSQAIEKYPYNNHDIDYAIFLSDRKRRNWNIYMNGELATCTRVKVNGPRCQFVECEKDEFGNMDTIVENYAVYFSTQNAAVDNPNVLLWISIPCTGGCSFQKINLRYKSL